MPLYLYCICKFQNVFVLNLLWFLHLVIIQLQINELWLLVRDHYIQRVCCRHMHAAFNHFEKPDVLLYPVFANIRLYILRRVLHLLEKSFSCFCWLWPCPGLALLWPLFNCWIDYRVVEDVFVLVSGKLLIQQFVNFARQTWPDWPLSLHWLFYFFVCVAVDIRVRRIQLNQTSIFLISRVLPLRQFARLNSTTRILISQESRTKVWMH